MAIVWPCSLSVDAYASAGRDVEFPRPDCPSCSLPMTFWSGYRRSVREAGLCQQIFVPRVRCRHCAVTHVLLPCFVLAGRLEVVETIGAVLEEVVDGPSGVRPAAARADVFHTTARSWLRRFSARAVKIGVSFAALAVELGGDAIAPFADPARHAIYAIRAAFRAASALPGWASIGLWRFASAVSGGRLIATNTDSPYLVVGKRRFMPPVPSLTTTTEQSHGT
jgi:transposase-like protein